MHNWFFFRYIRLAFTGTNLGDYSWVRNIFKGNFLSILSFYQWHFSSFPKIPTFLRCLFNFPTHSFLFYVELITFFRHVWFTYYSRAHQPFGGDRGSFVQADGVTKRTWIHRSYLQKCRIFHVKKIAILKSDFSTLRKSNLLIRFCHWVQRVKS